MSALIVYGSLMGNCESGAEFDGRTGFPDARSQLVYVRGFRREFSQEPSWRKGSGDRRGVLTVVPRAGASFNAVLVSGVNGEALRDLDHRERGYDRVELATAQIAPFGAPAPALSREPVFMYVGKPRLYNASLRPNDRYLDHCLEIAAARGGAFLRAFLDTTFVGGVPLRSF